MIEIYDDVTSRRPVDVVIVCLNEGIGASGTGWRQSGIKTTVTKAGTYLIIFVANFNTTNPLEGVRVRIGDNVYSQNLINMTISQAVQVNSIYIASGVGANTVVTGDLYSGASKDAYCEIIAIRMP